MQYNKLNIAPYAKIAIKLLQGPIFDDTSDLWNELNKYEVELTKYFEKIALDLVIDKRDRYAYLKQVELDDSGTTIGLIRRTSLTYELTLVCTLLLEWLLEFESDDFESENLYITPKQFRERLEMFFQEKANELKFVRELNRYLGECEKYGFLKLVHKDSMNEDDNRYEVKRIIKARFKNDELAQFKAMLEEDVQSI
jgi:hypothetical protein